MVLWILILRTIFISASCFFMLCLQYAFMVTWKKVLSEDMHTHTQKKKTRGGENLHPLGYLGWYFNRWRMGNNVQCKANSEYLFCYMKYCQNLLRHGAPSSKCNVCCCQRQLKMMCYLQIGIHTCNANPPFPHQETVIHRGSFDGT